MYETFDPRSAGEESICDGLGPLDDLTNTDPAAPAVIAAFEAAERAGLSTRECYKAGVEVWRQVHPDEAATYAAQQAVEVILRAKVSLRVEA